MTHTELLIRNQAVKEVLDSMGLRIERRLKALTKNIDSYRWFVYIDGEECGSYQSGTASEVEEYQEFAIILIKEYAESGKVNQ